MVQRYSHAAADGVNPFSDTAEGSEAASLSPRSVGQSVLAVRAFWRHLRAVAQARADAPELRNVLPTKPHVLERRLPECVLGRVVEGVIRDYAVDAEVEETEALLPLVWAIARAAAGPSSLPAAT
jgi:hypothetical protein